MNQTMVIEQHKEELQDFLSKNNYLIARCDSHVAGVDGYVVTDMKRIIQSAQLNGENSIYQAIVKVEDLTHDLVSKLYNYYCKAWLNR